MEGMTIEKLQVIIEAYTKPYRDEIEKVKKQTSAATSHVERQTSIIRNSFARVGRTVATVLSVAAITAFGKSCIDLGSDLQEVQNVVNVTFGAMSGRVDAFSKNAIKQFGLSELTAKKYMGTYGAMAKSFGIVEEAGYQMSASITGLTGDVASFYNLSTDEAYTKLKSIFTGETESLKELGVVMTQTALDQYALNNGFGKTTANMTEQEKVMLRYRFVMSSLSDASEDFARTSGSWANQVRVLQLQFESLKATIGQGLINAFTPVIQVINTILAKMQTLAAYFKAFTVALFGDAGGSSDIASSMASAAGSSGTVADNMGAAASAAKDMKNSLAAFDEINNLTSNSSSGGSGGGSVATDIDFGNFNWDDRELEDKLKEKLGSLYDFGDYISEALTKSMNRIDWESVYGGARNFGTGLADFLNGLISPELFGATGRTIAGALNTGIYAALSFGQEFDWSDLGLSIAESINEFFKTFDFASAGQTVTTFASGILDMATEAVEHTDWILVGAKIGEFFANIDWGTVLAKTGELIVAAIGAEISLYAGMIEVAPLETAIMAGIAAFKFVGVGKLIAEAIGKSVIDGISLKEIIITIGTVTLSGGSIPALDVIGNQIIDGIESFITEAFGERVTMAIGDGLLITVSAGIGTLIGGPIGTFAGAVIGTILDAFTSEDSLGAQIGSTLFNFDFSQQILEEAQKAFENAFAAENFAEFGYWIVEGVIDGILGALAFLGEPFADLFDTVVEEICNAFGINSPAKNMKPYGEYILLGIIKGFKETFGSWTESLNTWFTQYISPWFTVKKWSDLYDTMKTQMKTKWDETVNQWKTDISDWWQNDVLSWFSAKKWESGLTGIKTGFETAFNAAFDGVKQLWNRFAEWLNDKLSFDIDPLEIAGVQVFDGASISLGKIPTFATGGFPTQGQMFVARESGPEMVGRIGGKTAVANNDQIVDAISKGVYMAMSSAGGTNEDTLYRALKRALQEVDFTAVMDTDKAFKAMQKKAEDYRKRTGKPAFGY